jgi:hypothetical protein
VKPFLLLAATALALPSICLAQGALWAPTVPQQSVDEPDRVSLTVSPADEPTPALKYRLIPTDDERTDGNAATNYYRALLHLKQIPKEHYQVYHQPGLSDQWHEGPLDDAKIAAIRKHLEPFDNTFDELKLAVYRERCDWDLGLDQLQGPDVIMYLLHDFQDMRELARLLDLRCRIELYENRIDDAWETLRQGTQLARDCAKPPLLITGLIGIAVESIMLRRMEDFISHPDAPNVYWALAELPEPLIDMREALEFEMTIGPRIFSALGDPEIARTPEEWERRLRDTWETLKSIAPQVRFGSENDGPNLLEGAAALGYAVTRYPGAKAYLVESGQDAEAVEAMPVSQVLLLAEKIYYRRMTDELLKLYYLPMHQRIDREGDTDALIQGLSESEPLPIGSLLLPAVGAAASAQDRLVFRIRGLQTVEALRQAAYANGSFPRRLQDLEALPAALDPYTLENFAYESTGSTASLRVIFPRRPQRGMSRVYELKLRPGTN